MRLKDRVVDLEGKLLSLQRNHQRLVEETRKVLVMQMEHADPKTHGKKKKK